MNERDTVEILKEFRERHSHTISNCDLADLDLTLTILPDSGVWKIADHAPAIFALARAPRRRW